MKYFLFLVILFAGCKSGQQPVEPTRALPDSAVELPVEEVCDSFVQYDSMTDDEETNVGRLNDFGFRLMRLLMPADKQMESTVTSPLSVAYVLGMLAMGADGDTRTELERALGMESRVADRLLHRLMTDAQASDTTVQTCVANLLALNQRYHLQPSYEDSASTVYGALVSRLDFSSPSSTKTINDWCNRRTRGLIPSVPLKLDDDMMLVLANAIYFKGGWSVPFRTTINDRFTNADGRGVSVPMMTSLEHRFYLQRSHYDMVRMDYGQHRYSMVVVLPHHGWTTRSVLQELNSRQWQADLNSMRWTKVYLGLPRFESYNEHRHLAENLEQLGMNTAFSRRANYSRMLKEKAFVSAMVQLARIKVNEQGTEAAAVTYAGMIGAYYDDRPERVVEFYANRPFLYAIIDNDTRCLHFLGEYRGEKDAPAMTSSIYREGDWTRESERAEQDWIDRHAEQAAEELDPNRAYDVVEQMPAFKYGYSDGLMKWLDQHIRYPRQAEEAGIKGRVIVGFVVEADGSLSNFEVLKSVHPELDAEALRVCRSMPKWIPGRQKGIAVRVKYVIPVAFKIDGTWR